MKKKAEEPQDADLLNEEQAAEDEKAKKLKTKSNPDVENVPLPFLVEFGITFSTAFLIIADLAIAGISLFSGARLLDIIIRTGVTTVVLGTLLWFFTMQLSNGALKAAYAEQKEREKLSAGQNLGTAQLHDFEG